MKECVFPLPRPESGEDTRFCTGLLLEVGDALTRYGYPALTGADAVELSMALFAFLYQPHTPDTDATAGKER